MFGKIVDKVKTENSNGKDGRIMDQTNGSTAVVEATVAPVVEKDGPVQIFKRKGAKGAGSLVVIATNKAEAEIIKAEVIKTVETGTVVYTRDYEAPVLMDAATWAKSVEEAQAAEKAYKAALAKAAANGLTAEEIALLTKGK